MGLIEKKQGKIKKITEELLAKLNITGDVVIVDKDSTPSIEITTEEAGLLIGFHGETLRPLELILMFLISKELGEFTRITLDIGGYRKQREEKLFELATKIKEQVKSEGQPQTIPNLSPGERRIIHLFFQDDKEVMTESQGEGEERQLVIKPR